MRRALLMTAALAVVAAVAMGTARPAVATQEAETAFQGRLTAVVDGERQGVEGVEITVLQDGEEIGSDTTGEEGTWRVEVPGGGTYTVVLDTDTLPEGVTLREGADAEVERTALPGRANGVIFPLGEAAGGAGGDLGFLLNLFAKGLKLGAILAMTALGLSLIFGVTGLVNFAHGELVTFGALAAWYLNAWSDGPQVHLVVAGALAVVAGGIFGAGLEAGMFGPLRRRRTGLVALIVVTIGLSFLLRYLYLMVFGGGTRAYLDYTVQRSVAFGPFSLPPKDWAAIGISLTVLVAVGLLLQRTRLGTAMRAVSDDRDLAESSGIDVQRVIIATWTAGGALAALGGILQATADRVEWDMGFTLLLLIFAAVILGGLGTAYGAMVGGLLIGIVTQVSTFWIDEELKFAVALAVLVVVLLLRPQGILGHAERVG